MGLIDAAAISAALTSNKTLRSNLRQLVQRLSKSAFSDGELGQIELELIRSLKLREASQLPSQVPSEGQALKLTAKQLDIVSHVVARFRNPALRTKCRSAVSNAVAEGRIAAA